MEPTLPDTLLVRRLPELLTEPDLNELFCSFGALRVCKERRGRNRNSTAVVRFKCHEDASYAMNRLHQLCIGGKRLVIEYADFSMIPEPQQIRNAEKFDYRWSYPPASELIVRNISSILFRNSEFYERVIQVMNSMNLPPPFDSETDDLCQEIEEVEMEELYKEDTEESELESEDNFVNDFVPPSCEPKKKKSTKSMKLTKLRRFDLNPTIAKSKSKPAQEMDQVFEKRDINTAKKMEVKISSEITNVISSHVEGTRVEGFGKFAPAAAIDNDRESINSEVEESFEFISKQKLVINRITDEEMKLLPAFKNYNPGTPNSRLYVKNIAKNVKESDLKHIFGRYIIWTCDDEKNKYVSILIFHLLYVIIMMDLISTGSTFDL